MRMVEAEEINYLNLLNDLANKFLFSLSEYLRKRKRNKIFFLRDIFLANIRDPHSLSHRINTVNFLQRKVQRFLEILYERNNEGFNQKALKFVHFIYEIIDVNDDKTSNLRKILLRDSERLVSGLLNNISDEKIRQQINERRHLHFNQVAAYPLSYYVKQLNLEIFPSLAMLPSIIKNVLFPKRKDSYLSSLKFLESRILKCQSTEDYVMIIKEIKEAMKNNQNNKLLYQTLTNMQKELFRKIFSGKLKGLSEIQKHTILSYMSIKKASDFLIYEEKSAIIPIILERNTLTLPANNIIEIGANEKEKLKYFREHSEQSFIYHILSHGISSTGLFKREAGILGKIGEKASLISAIPTFGSGLAGSFLNMPFAKYDDYHKESVDKNVGENIIYNIIEELAEQLSFKVAYRFAFQVSQLYHSNSYPRAIDKLIQAIIENALENFSLEKFNIILDQKLYKEEYKNFVNQSLSSNQSLAKNSRFLTLHADILSDCLLYSIHESSFRLPAAGMFIFAPGHLRHINDDNNILSTQKWSIYGVLQKSGYVIQKENGNMEFYSAEGLHPEKYGYIFVNEHEINKKIFHKQKVSIEISQRYEELYSRYSPSLIKNIPSAKNDRQKFELEKELLDLYQKINNVSVAISDIQVIQKELFLLEKKIKGHEKKDVNSSNMKFVLEAIRKKCKEASDKQRTEPSKSIQMKKDKSLFEILNLSTVYSRGRG
jgi:hypothetical protein